VSKSGLLATKGFLRFRKKSATNIWAYNACVPLADGAPERAWRHLFT
jgi:hypothetical protein